MLICGEASGDLLGAEMIDALNNYPYPIIFSGIVGTECLKRGVTSLIPLADIAVMGFTEIFTSLPRLYRAKQVALNHIKTHKPDYVIMIDAFAFTHPIAVSVKKHHPEIKIIKYVPPKLWAWLPYRAKKMRGIYDIILATLPFEKEFFKSYGLETIFVGHSVTERIPKYDEYAIQNFREYYNLNPQAKNMLLLPGSRKKEIIKLLPVFLETAGLLKEKYSDLQFILPIAQGYETLLVPYKKQLDLFNIRIIHTIEDRFTAFHLADAALAASGTVSLELMMTNTPMVIAYKLSPMTAFFARYLVRLPSVSLLNIILKRNILPEFLQDMCQADKLTCPLSDILEKQQLYSTQLDAFIQGRNALIPHNNQGQSLIPSQAVAEAILQGLKQEKQNKLN